MDPDNRKEIPKIEIKIEKSSKEDRVTFKSFNANFLSYLNMLLKITSDQDDKHQRVLMLRDSIQPLFEESP